MDPYNPMIDVSVFHFNADWVEFYGNVAEEDTPRMSQSFGDPVSTSTFFETDHASIVATKISHTDILLFFFNYIIKDLRKRGNTVK